MARGVEEKSNTLLLLSQHSPPPPSFKKRRGNYELAGQMAMASAAEGDWRGICMISIAAPSVSLGRTDWGINADRNGSADKLKSGSALRRAEGGREEAEDPPPPS